MHARVLLLAAALVAAASSPAAAAGNAGAVTALGPPRLLEPAGGPSEGSPNLSGDGRYVAYAASSFDVQGHLHRRLQRKDLLTGAIAVLNRRPDGAVAGGNYSLAPVISADGTQVAFTSNSARLTPADPDDRFDAFVRNVPTATTLLASGADGQAGVASLSDDGRWAVFTSTGTDLVPGSTSTNTDVYLRDLTSGGVTQVTVRPDGSPSRGTGAQDADVNSDGGVVAFASYATDLAPADGDDGALDLFVRDVRAGTTRWLGGRTPGDDLNGVVLSPDGRWAATRYAGSLYAIRTSTAEAIFVAAGAGLSKGAFSADGRLLCYITGGRAYVRDLVNGAVHELRTPAGGVALSSAALSGDGRRAAYDWVADGSEQVRTYLVDLTRG